MEVWISAVIGLLGTLAGAGIAWLAAGRRNRVEAAFALHREFHSVEMTHSRNLAGKVVQDHESETFDAMRRRLPPDETQHVWNVMYFYQRLWLAIKYGNIKGSFVPEMFGENFCWWYLKSYERQLVPLDWQSSHHIDELMKWIEANSRSLDLEKWRQRARRMNGVGLRGEREGDGV